MLLIELKNYYQPLFNMAANEITYLPNEPVQLYLVSPTAAEKELGYTSWATTAYHKRQGSCYFMGLDYCTPVNKDVDKLTFQFKAKTTGSNVILTQYNPYLTGTNTSVTATKLVDSGAPFGSVTLNQLVQNTDDNTASYVSVLDSTSVLTLEQDIFTATPKDYAIYPILVNANFRYYPLTDLWTVATAGSGNYIEFLSALTVGNWYKVTIDVTDITAGSIAVKLGSATIATIDSVGTHIVYGKCLTTTSFIVEGSTTFVGSFGGLDLDVRELVTDYSIILFDKDTELFVDYISWSETTDSLTIGNIFVNIAWNDASLDPACGSYVIGVTADPVCDGDIVQNGDMSSATGWALDSDVTISTGFLRFSGVVNGNGASNTLTCPIEAGKEYTVSWDIGYMPGNIKTGSYIFYTAEGYVSPSYSSDVQTPGTYSFTFTATLDSTSIRIEQYGEAGSTFTIDNLSVTVAASALIADMDGLSECLCVCVNDCTTLIKYKNTAPSFGNYYAADSNYMYLRVPGRLRNAITNDLELNSFKSTLDNQIQPYNNLNRIEELATQPMPEYSHNSLAIGLSHSTVLIDGISYKRTGAYAPDWGDDELAKVIVNVGKTNQNYLRNNY